MDKNRSELFFKKLHDWSNKPIERGSFKWLLNRSVYAVLNRRFKMNTAVRGVGDFFKVFLIKTGLGIRCRLESQHSHRRTVSPKNSRKILYASPVGSRGKENLKNIIERFKGMDVKYLIFVYDETSFDDAVFSECEFVRESGFKWYFMKKYLTPEKCNHYDYILPWDDDIDIGDFSPENFLNIMESNDLDVAQPSLEPHSYYTHEATLKRQGHVGRFSDFVEIMVQCFRTEAWIKFWNMIEADGNYWGWGYDVLANDLCDFKRTAIVDQESVIHTKDFDPHPSTHSEMKSFMKKYPKAKKARFITYGKLMPAEPSR